MMRIRTYSAGSQIYVVLRTARCAGSRSVFAGYFDCGEYSTGQGLTMLMGGGVAVKSAEIGEK